MPVLAPISFNTSKYSTGARAAEDTGGTTVAILISAACAYTQTVYTVENSCSGCRRARQASYVLFTVCVVPSTAACARLFPRADLFELLYGAAAIRRALGISCRRADHEPGDYLMTNTDSTAKRKGKIPKNGSMSESACAQVARVDWGRVVDFDAVCKMCVCTRLRSTMKTVPVTYTTVVGRGAAPRQV